MFCVNCGREIIDTARFCNFCGSKTPLFTTVPEAPAAFPMPAPMPAPVSEPFPVPAPISERLPMDVTGTDEHTPSEPLPSVADDTEDAAYDEPDVDVSETEAPTDEAAAAPDEIASDDEPLAETVRSAPSYAQTTAPYAQPVGSAPMITAVPGAAPTPPVSAISGVPFAQNQYAVPTAAEKPRVPASERRYTLGHIILCLISTAVMAVTAGVFAALYFSVV